MITSIIVDDEPEGIKILKNLLSRYSWISVTQTFKSPDEALTYCREQVPDVIFLDIEMPGMSGMEFQQALEHYHRDVHIIFTTAFDQYGIEAIKHRAFDYLLKPIDPDDLNKSLVKLQDHLATHGFMDKLEGLIHQNHHSERLKINTRTGFLWINQHDIIYCEASSNYSVVYLKNHRSETTSLTLGKLEELLTLNLFKRVGRSLIINMNYLFKVDRKLKQCSLVCDGEVYLISIPERIDWE